MTELIGDICMPSEFILPSKATVDLPASPKIGTVFFNTTTNSVNVWNGTSYIGA